MFSSILLYNIYVTITRYITECMNVHYTLIVSLCCASINLYLYL